MQKDKRSIKYRINASKRNAIFGGIGVWVIILFVVFTIIRFSDKGSPILGVNIASSSNAIMETPAEMPIGETKSGLDLGSLDIGSSLATFEILGKTDEEKEKIYSHVKVEQEGMVCDIYWPDMELSQDELDILVVAGGQLYEDRLNEKESDIRYNIMSERAIPEEIESIGGNVAYYIDKDYTLHLYGKLTIKDLQKNTESVEITELKLRYGEKYLELE